MAAHSRGDREVFGLDIAEHFAYCDERWSLCRRRSPREVYGRPWWEVFPQGIFLGWPRIVDRVLRHGETVMERGHFGPDLKRDHDAYFRPKWEAGKIVGMIGVLRPRALLLALLDWLTPGGIL